MDFHRFRITDEQAAEDWKKLGFESVKVGDTVDISDEWYMQNPVAIDVVVRAADRRQELLKLKDLDKAEEILNDRYGSGGPYLFEP